jgi:hypothetical protein
MTPDRTGNWKVYQMGGKATKHVFDEISPMVTSHRLIV